MCLKIILLLFSMYFDVNLCFYSTNYDSEDKRIDMIDLTRPTSWKDISEYYGAVEKHWSGGVSEAISLISKTMNPSSTTNIVIKQKICLNCGTPSLGTVMHMERPGSASSMHPAVIPVDYLITRLTIIDVSSMTRLDPNIVLTLDVALQWMSLKHDPKEITILLFKFGWKEEDSQRKIRSCVCKVPGLSYELASWIATNLSHVVGVATDAPTLESEDTREFTSRTVTNLLGKNGIYMIENVNLKRKLPDQGCMTIVTPLKMLNANFVPATLTAFCPSVKTHMHVVLTLTNDGRVQQPINSRLYDVNLEEILN